MEIALVIAVIAALFIARAIKIVQTGDASGLRGSVFSR